VRERFESEEPALVRELHNVIGDGVTVLDVGCGANPHWRANVCCDINPGAWEPADHPSMRFVEGDIHHLPFGHKEFGFVICRQVLEHVRDPAQACAELSRVGERGYVEVPTAVTEAIFNTEAHGWLCREEDGGLLFRPKGPQPFWTGPGEFLGVRVREDAEGLPPDAAVELRRLLDWAGQYRICLVWEGTLRGRILWG
jgi:SAM-dependent methyltransferase